MCIIKCCSVVFRVKSRLLVIHFVVVSHINELCHLTRHGPSLPSVLQLVLRAFTARDGDRYWLRIAISAYPKCN